MLAEYAVEGYVMARRDLFLGHRFPKDVIFLAVRWYCRYPLSYPDLLRSI